MSHMWLRQILDKMQHTKHGSRSVVYVLHPASEARNCLLLQPLTLTVTTIRVLTFRLTAYSVYCGVLRVMQLLTVVP